MTDPMDGCWTRAHCLNNNFDDCSQCCGWMSIDDALVSQEPLLYAPRYLGSPKHPVAVERKAQKGAGRKAERDRRKTGAYTSKSRLVRKAYKTERETRNAVIRATQRSGALNGDGDSRLGDGTVGIDDKLQTRATHQFTVKVDEVEKARTQNCFLTITTKTGRKFAVAELDYFIAAAAHIGAIQLT